METAKKASSRANAATKELDDLRAEHEACSNALQRSDSQETLVEARSDLVARMRDQIRQKDWQLWYQSLDSIAKRAYDEKQGWVEASVQSSKPGMKPRHMSLPSHMREVAVFGSDDDV